MGFWEWARDLAQKVTTRIETGLRELLELHEEIRLPVIERPATLAEIEELIDEMAQTERFIRDYEPEEARRLAQGALPYERLTNVARVRQWTTLSPQDIIPKADQQITIRSVIVGPDGRMTYTDVAFGQGEAYDHDEFIRRCASAIEDDFAGSYQVGRSQMARDWIVSQETYIQTYTPL